MNLLFVKSFYISSLLFIKVTILYLPLVFNLSVEKYLVKFGNRESRLIFNVFFQKEIQETRFLVMLDQILKTLPALYAESGVSSFFLKVDSVVSTSNSKPHENSVFLP